MTHELELGDAFQARHLAVPMTQAFSVRPEQRANDAASALQARRFDQAPVADGDQVLGFVLTRRLVPDSTVRVLDVMSAVGSGNVVSADASVGRLLEWIIDPGLLFVLEGRDITGFITVSDFNKQPARGYLYLLLARLETGLAELIRQRFGQDQGGALALLPERGQAVVRERYESDVAAGEEGELVAYFDFSDLVFVVGADEELRRLASGNTRNGWRDHVGGLVKLRNDVMHPVRNIVLAKGGLIQLQGRERRIRDLVERIDLLLSI